VSSSSSTHSHGPGAHGSGSGDSPIGIILIATVAAVIITIICAWAAGTDFWFPARASTMAPQIDFVFNFITWLCIFFFAQIMILMTVFVVKYRRKGHEKATSDITHNTPLELTWTIIPLLLVIAIFYVGMEGYMNLRRPPIGAYEVQAMAQKWTWSFSHRSGCNETVLRVPVNTPVKVLMESQDVLHALFIPAFRVKQDIVPGRVTYLWFEATQVGEFDLFCAEYCGKDHSMMRTKVIVQEQADFEASIEECRDWIKDTPQDQYAAKALERIYPRCASCHSLDGKTGTGPTWRDLWAKLEKGDHVFTDGTKLADIMGPGKMYEGPEDYLMQSILNPQQKIVMNYTGAMPTFKGQLKDEEVRAIIEAIKHLDEFDDKGKRKAGG